ncbi:MAG TPA: tetratricopeptide repeat protein [Stellaceae bacterium]|nr:tetratricopeptide repeat protein [Stellaceae bacterium]
MTRFLAALLCFALYRTALAAEPAKTAPAPLPHDAAAAAATYARCLKLAETEPAAARVLAGAWASRGGAHPAEHCAAVALFHLGQYKEAATRLDALAHQMNKGPADLVAGVLDQAGEAWLMAGDPVRAYADCGAALILAPDDPGILTDRAQAAAAAGHYDRAVGDLDRVLGKDPNEVDALVYRAAAYRALGRLDPALADADKAVALRPHSLSGLLERGNIRRLKGDNAGARADWLELRRLAPHSPEAVAAAANLKRLDAKGGAPSR